MADPHPGDDAWELDAGIVRPYLFTGGRTRPNRSTTLPVETMLSSTPLARATSSTLPAEQRHIVERCVEPRSLAEVASSLGAPLGVVRVLVADLYTTGLIDVHEAHEPRDPRDDILLLRRLITRIEAIA
ncbi:MAG TPA: DUF742 domain-containing protein [Acidimicrobiales bacterium]|nr:DUF742 domain-containing protein [Acidimicrobiales bacterium]